ncbi:MAG: thioredoxin family protein [Bacteroidota bacterium]
MGGYMDNGKKLTALFVFLLSVAATASAQLNWTSFEHLNDSLRQEARPLLIFIHADWCAYCKRQESEVFAGPAVVQKLNTDYYCLKLDAEGREALRFMGRSYQFISTGYETGQHELAQFLGSEDGQLSLPTTLVLDKSLQLKWRETSLVETDFLLELLE